MGMQADKQSSFSGLTGESSDHARHRNHTSWMPASAGMTAAGKARLRRSIGLRRFCAHILFPARKKINKLTPETAYTLV